MKRMILSLVLVVSSMSLAMEEDSLLEQTAFVTPPYFITSCGNALEGCKEIVQWYVARIVALFSKKANSSGQNPPKPTSYDSLEN
jgi:hypothetical protein